MGGGGTWEDDHKMCWKQWGTGGKVEKHESYFEDRNLGCHLIQIVMAKESNSSFSY